MPKRKTLKQVNDKRKKQGFKPWTKKRYDRAIKDAKITSKLGK